MGILSTLRSFCKMLRQTKM